MKIAIAGGHGKIALLTTKLLAASGHEVWGIVRNPAHAADLEAAGGHALVLDLEQSDSERLAGELASKSIDAVVFAAGAGPGSSAERKLTVDRDGAVLLADAAWRAEARRYILISAIGADDFDPASDDVFQVYLRAKKAADDDVRGRDLDWTIVRPGRLIDDVPTGRVQLGKLERGSVTRGDVAHVLAEVFDADNTIGKTFDVLGGDVAIKQAVSNL